MEKERNIKVRIDIETERYIKGICSKRQINISDYIRQLIERDRAESSKKESVKKEYKFL